MDDATRELVDAIHLLPSPPSPISENQLSTIDALLNPPPFFLPHAQPIIVHSQHAPAAVLLVNRPDEQGYAPMHYAAMQAHPRADLFRVLWGCGADVGLRTWTPAAEGVLHLLARYVSAEGADIERLVGMLVNEMGAPVEARNRKGMCALGVAMEVGRSESVVRALLAASGGGKEKEKEWEGVDDRGSVVPFFVCVRSAYYPFFSSAASPLFVLVCAPRPLSLCSAPCRLVGVSLVVWALFCSVCYWHWLHVRMMIGLRSALAGLGGFASILGPDLRYLALFLYARSWCLLCLHFAACFALTPMLCGDGLALYALSAPRRSFLSCSPASSSDHTWVLGVCFHTMIVHWRFVFLSFLRLYLAALPIATFILVPDGVYPNLFIPF